jgi:hypothetical protein
MPRCVLLVDLSAERLTRIRRRLSYTDDVVACSDFRFARTQLLARQPTFLVSHSRLGEFNALHLVYLAVGASLPTRFILFDEPRDAILVAEARSLGAFYETTSRLPFSLPSYMQASLPNRDRRESAAPDRRTLFRSGRRAADVAPEIRAAVNMC